MKKLKKDMLSELVYERIKLMIHDGIIIPGQKILRRDIAKMLDVSLTPVREAVNRLVGEGFIEQKSREGFFMKTFTYEDLKELFAVRAALEGVAVRICIEQLKDDKMKELTLFFEDFSPPIPDNSISQYLKVDQAFHKKIIQLCGNSLIIDYDKNFDFILKSYQKGLLRDPDETLNEHREIINAIKEKNGQKAHELIVKHHLKTRDYIKTQHLKY